MVLWREHLSGKEVNETMRGSLFEWKVAEMFKEPSAMIGFTVFFNVPSRGHKRQGNSEISAWVTGLLIGG